MPPASFYNFYIKGEFIPDVGALTAIIFVIFFMTCSQDIAVDGWCLTMLKPINVGYAATCAAVGIQTGQFIGFAVFMTLG